MASSHIEVARVYKNAAGETIRMDEIRIAGFWQRKYVYDLRTSRRTDFDPDEDWGDWRFYSDNGLQIEPTLFHLDADRTVAEIEMFGEYSAVDTANFDWFDWTFAGSTRREDLSALPDVADSV